VKRSFLSIVACSAIAVLMSAPLFAQGNSGKNGTNNGQAASGSSGKNSNAGGKGKGGGTVTPPSEVALAAPSVVSSATSASTPFAWIDNANVIAPGSVWIGISTVRWHNADVSEVNFPVVDAAVGMTPRLQFGVSIPRIAANDVLGRPAGLGTTFFNAKVALLNSPEHPVKAAIAPTLEILNGAAQFAAVDQSRVQWGLPFSVEFDRGVSRVYGSTGYFSPGIWYTGAGVGAQIGTRLGIAVSLSRAWSRLAPDNSSLAAPRRHDLSTGISMDLTPNVGIFGSVGRTFATASEYGAGTTVSVGLSLSANRIAATP